MRAIFYAYAKILTLKKSVFYEQVGAKHTIFVFILQRRPLERLIYILITFGYVLIFGVLGTMTLFTKIPAEKGMESYKMARRTLGIGLCMLSLYSLIRLIIPQTHADYIDFWLLVTFTLIHSWLTYSSLLFLMETPRFKIRHFLIDGMIPTIFMIVAGMVGLFFESIRVVMEIIFGCIFGIKCTWMFYTCLTEYNKCRNDIENYYSEEFSIRWIRSIIYISIIMSAATIVSFYVPQTHLVYYSLIPIIYTYIVVNIMNFLPKKLDDVRHKNYILEEAPLKVKTEKTKDLAEKISPKVNEWIKCKHFCQADLTIKDVAMEMGTNHNYLSQYLNNTLGMTFQVWLNTLRIEESKAILTSGEKISIEEVGIRVGIPQSYNFSRWFKAVTDMTPYQYRKQNS